MNNLNDLLVSCRRATRALDEFEASSKVSTSVLKQKLALALGLERPLLD
jgi:hypothetical protein